MKCETIVILFCFKIVPIASYNTLNIKLSNSQTHKLKSGIEINTEITLKILSKVVCNSTDKNNFLNKLFLTNTQVSKLRKAIANDSSANIKSPKTA